MRIYNDLHVGPEAELVALANRAVPLTTDESGHMIPIREPDIGIEAIDRLRSMIEADPQYDRY